MREKYRMAYQMARYLQNQLNALNRENPPNARLVWAVWTNYERMCWVNGISYQLAYQTRDHLENRSK